MCYGAGRDSIKGFSEESRFISNPFLLVGICAGVTYYRDKNTNNFENLTLIEPISLTWRKDIALAMVKYGMSSFWGIGNFKKVFINLVAYNARDFGFEYFYIEPEKTQNITFTNTNREVARIQQFIHCGNSCGYPGGCNNMSPYDSNMEIIVEKLPAKIYIKLWKDESISSEEEADMIYIMELI